MQRRIEAFQNPETTEHTLQQWTAKKRIAIMKVWQSFSNNMWMYRSTFASSVLACHIVSPTPITSIQDTLKCLQRGMCVAHVDGQPLQEQKLPRLTEAELQKGTVL
jgi:hypothetical protein